MILFDTDHASVAYDGRGDRAARLRGRLDRAGDELVGAPITVVEEQMRGWMASIAKERQAVRQVAAYRELAGLFEFYGKLYVAPIDEAAAERFDQLRATHRRLGAMDLKIAAVALTRPAVLLSANLRDFSQIPGLRVEKWLD